jgi:FkbM family methyltransferase
MTETSSSTIETVVLKRFRDAFRSSEPEAPASGLVTRESVLWAYRLFLDREPESEAAVDLKLAGHGTTRDMRRDFMSSAEFRSKNVPDLAYTSERSVVIKEIAPGLRLFVDLADVAIGLNVVRDRYEVSESRFMDALIQPGDSVLDVGANVGFHTIQMAARVGPSGRVCAFEPMPQNLEFLRRSIEENGFEERIVVQDAAVSESVGQSEMVFLSLDERSFNSGGGHLRIPGQDLLPAQHALKVRTVTLDQCDLRRPVRLIKIDIEGAEPLALGGARELLRADRPTILSEINPPQIEEVSGRGPADFIAEMAKLGYRCFLLVEGRPGSEIRDVPDQRVRSVVFSPR